MFVGKWNKSVILTYLGVVISVLGMVLALNSKIKIAIILLILAGICDLFDGVVARKCKRTEEEKNFGIQLDSLADVVDFGVFPIIISISINNNPLLYIIYAIYIVAQIARLAYFNIKVSDNNNPVEYYQGLPVTFSALILPIVFLTSYFVSREILSYIFAISMLIIAFLNILKFKLKKPRGKAYIFFAILALIVISIYMVF